ncbi:hypothetical protein EYB25_004589 [Talaromyces marneffei]|uniref:Chromatin assembly factor 1 subunit A, putative n=2 Tax=Talaromyces marneffei TaxID=37727 RepID=B6QFP7_TALMQ|nr:chromatin assembly factor 1 subunit A, putative [Talaromyces marneffei ATCC 18224]KAE8553207.1 hypothetical protein EYB25_004589 [Talaromyces marneffei]
MSSPTNAQARKRAFSEVEDHNIPKPETHKMQRVGNGEQENQDPLHCDHDMDIDKPIVSVANTATNKTTDIPALANQTSQIITTESAPLITPSSVTTVPIVPSTPPRQQPQPSSAAGAAANPPNKKLKLSPSTKETKRKEKEEKDRLKLEEKAKKDAEKKAKEEERKKKEAEKEEERKKREAEREEKKKQKEEEKQAKEEEKRKKEEEKEKKERSQMRLNAFFSKPAAAVTKAASPVPSSPQKEAVRETANPESPAKPQRTQSEYRKEFPVFFLQSHTHISPPHQFQRDGEALNHIQQKLDSYLKQPISLPAYRGAELFDMIPYQRRRGMRVVPVKTILSKAQNADSTASSTALRDELKKVTMKSLRFGEDVRPAYYGTFTKQLSRAQAHKVCRAPYARVLPEINYDYDSEAEWEEPEEGEDLDSEGEEDASDDGEDDMDGFLDDDDEPIDSRRRLIVGDQEPICTGIRWDDGKHVDPDMEIYRIEALSDTLQFPIDPFSTAYWPKPKAVEQPAPKASSSLPHARATLHAFGVNSTTTHTSSPLAPPVRPVTITDSKALPKAKKPFPPEHMEEFKQIVEGCDLSKAGLIEVLKKRFPKISKDTLKDTVNAVAVRVGQKEADKKWTCK